MLGYQPNHWTVDDPSFLFSWQVPLSSPRDYSKPFPPRPLGPHLPPPPQMFSASFVTGAMLLTFPRQHTGSVTLMSLALTDAYSFFHLALLQAQSLLFNTLPATLLLTFTKYLAWN